jgi:hypothetical protein
VKRSLKEQALYLTHSMRNQKSFMRLAPGIGRFAGEVFHHCPPDLAVAKAEKVVKWNSALCKVLM